MEKGDLCANEMMLFSRDSSYFHLTLTASIGVARGGALSAALGIQ
jgi:hypothetical protein